MRRNCDRPAVSHRRRPSAWAKASSRARTGILIGTVVAIAVGVLTTFRLAPASFSQPAAAPASASAPLQYVALGDSYSAGEGLAPYESGTNTPSDSCHRSKSQAYPSLVAKFLKLKSFSFHACSGARLAALTTPFKTENAQLDWLFASPSPDLVTLSLGGNDLDWSTTLQDCAQVHNGGRNTPVIYGPSSQCDERLADAPNLISSITNQLFADYKTIRADAPNARIRVMLYPPIFPDRAATTDCVIGTRLGFAIALSAAHETAMYHFEQDFNNAIKLAVDSIRTNFNGGDFYTADPATEFLGYTGHTIDCGDAGRDKPWVNALRTEGFPTRSPTNKANILKDLISFALQSNGSFHPTVAGQQAMAQALEESLQLSAPPASPSPSPSPTTTSSAPPVIATGSLPDGYLKLAYSQPLDTTDHRAGTWSVTAGHLPDGLTLSGSVIQGTPTTAGTYSFTVTFTDSQGQSVSAPLSITVSPWTPVEGGAPANGSSNPAVSSGTSVSCLTASSCVAVGGYNLLTGTSVSWTADVLTQSGSTWAATQAPLPANAQVPGSGVYSDAELNQISCPTSSSCVAAGNYQDSTGNKQGMLLTLAGGEWTAAQAPLPADASTSDPDVSLYGISCSSTSSCVAVGDYTDSALKSHPLLLTLNSGSWTAAAAPMPATSPGNSGVLFGVSCPSPSACLAVGNYLDSQGTYHGVLLTLAGGSWTAADAKLPADAAAQPFTRLYGVSCVSAANCTVVGVYYGPSTSAGSGLILTLLNGSWTAVTAPLPPGTSGTPDVTLEDVSCPTSTACVAGGFYTSTRNRGELLTLANGSWTAVNAPAPANAGTTVVDSVWGISCPSTASCTATGQYSGSDGMVSLFLTGPA